MEKIGTRVLAIKSSTEDEIKIFGEGEYLGDLVPSKGIMGRAGITNPCIKLDNGKYIWGYECWWGEAERLKERFYLDKKVTIVDDFEEVKPKGL